MTAVRLPFEYQPRFPNRCVGCGRPHPHHAWQPGKLAEGEGYQLGANWFAWLPDVQVPYCNKCHPTLSLELDERRQPWLPAAALLGFLFAALSLYLVALYSPTFSVAVALPLIALAVAYGVTWFQRFQHFSLGAIGDEFLEYRFADDEFAHEFRRLNSEAAEAALPESAGLPGKSDGAEERTN